MKSNIRKSAAYAAAVIILYLLSVSCNERKIPDDYLLPEFVSISAEPGYSQCTLKADIALCGQLREFGFYYWKDASRQIRQTVAQENIGHESGLAHISLTVSGLDRGCNYDFCAFAVLDGTDLRSDVRSFRTEECDYEPRLWEFILGKYDADKNGELSEQEARSVMDENFYRMGLSSLAGVERLRWLEYLYSASNDISEVDLSSNQRLVWVELQDNSLKYADLSMLSRLEGVYVSENPLEGLVLPKGKLRTLGFNDTRIKNVDLSGQSLLTELRAEKACLEGEIDLSHCPALERCDLSQNPGLKTVWLAKGQKIRDFKYDSSTVVRYRE